MRKSKSLISLILIIIASIYLTFLIDTYTLNTWLKRAFIFCYFVIVSCLVFYIYNKSKKHKITIIPLLCAIVVLSLGQNFFLPTAAEHTIYLQATATEGSAPAYKEVWLVELEADDKNIKLSNVELNDNIGWTYSDAYDDYYFASIGDLQNDKNNIISFTVVAKEVRLSFGTNKWSGKVRIFDEDGHDEIISLNAENAESAPFDYTLNVTKKYSIFERILYNSGAVIVLCFAFKVLFWIICHFVQRKKSESKSAQPDDSHKIADQ